ncbi:MAG: outer membrane protein assembly factor BamD [Candidatus Omnitrophica bacterium]|nr:outer membrane protein assembly factor BamD [Candidatus Omnitrophota bacterium]
MFLRKIIIFVILFSAVAVSPAYPYWIWSPKTGKWWNPKNMPKETPQEQFEYAKSFYDQKNYDDARKEFGKLLSNYPKSAEAAESQYYVGLIEEAQDRLFEAYLAYQKVIDKYPFSERIKEVIEREYAIAEKFIAGEKRKVLGVTIPVDNPAIEILNKVIENSTYGPLASKAEYKLGLVLKGLMRYYEAEEAFNKVIVNYPESEWVEPSRYQIAECRAAVSRGPEYDQGAAQEAKEKFEDFVRENPEAALSREAEKNINTLREKDAESNFEIGRFYEKQEVYESAKIYYNEVINKYPRSQWAAKSLERLQIMERMK